MVSLTRCIIPPRFTLRGFSSSLANAAFSASDIGTWRVSCSAKQLVATRSPSDQNCRYDGKTPEALFGCILSSCTNLDQFGSLYCNNVSTASARLHDAGSAALRAARLPLLTLSDGPH
jgi:hypothetical protein